MLRVSACSLLLAPAVLALPAHAEHGSAQGAAAYTLHLDSGLAPLISGKRIATFPQARSAFGAPGAVSATVGEPDTCQASWPRLSLVIDFATSQPESCEPRYLGGWKEVTARSKAWHTYAGLHVGDSERRLHVIYQRTRRLDFLGHGRTWELETGGPYCDGGPPLSLAAEISSTRVAALAVFHVPACG